MIKLYRKANVCLRVDKNFAALTVFNSLVVLSLVFLLSEVVLADEKIKKSHGFNFFGELRSTAS